MSPTLCHLVSDRPEKDVDKYMEEEKTTYNVTFRGDRGGQCVDF